MNQLAAAQTGPTEVAGVSEDVAVLGTLAGLPASFFISTSPDAPVRSVPGDGNWTQAVIAAIDQGPRVVVVTDPVPCAGLDDVIAAARGRVHVVLAEGWTGDPALTGAADAWPDALAAGTLLELELVVGPTTSREVAVLTALRLMRTIGRPVPAPECVCASDDAIAIVAREGRSTWSLLITRTAGPPRARISVSDKNLQVAIDLSAPVNGAPGTARLVDRTREVRLDARYESGYRPAWRRARSLVDAVPGEPLALRDLAADLRAVDAILASPLPKPTRKGVPTNDR